MSRRRFTADELRHRVPASIAGLTEEEEEGRGSAGGSKNSNVKPFPPVCSRTHKCREIGVRIRLVDASLRQFPLTGGRLTKEAAISSTQRNQTAHLKSTIHRTPLFEGLP